MNALQNKNGVNTLSPQEEKKEKDYWELFALLNPKQAEERLKRNTQIKDYLLENSYLVQFQAKEASGKSLSKAEQAKQERIYDLRDKVFSNIKKELVKYYQAVIKGDYRFAGMPEIKGGIRDWAETKIWHLLISLGEPNNLRYSEKNDDYWTEAE